MLKNLTIFCEDVAIDTKYSSNDIKLELKNVEPCFLDSIKINDLIRNLDHGDILKAIAEHSENESIEDYLDECDWLHQYLESRGYVFNKA